MNCILCEPQKNMRPEDAENEGNHPSYRDQNISDWLEGKMKDSADRDSAMPRKWKPKRTEWVSTDQTEVQCVACRTVARSLRVSCRSCLWHCDADWSQS